MAFSFFDDEVSLEVKEEMRNKVIEKSKYTDESDDYEYILPKKIILKNQDVEQVVEKGIVEFVSPNTLQFFNRFEMDTSFLNEPSSEWEKNEEYPKMKKVAEKIKVVNDCAERGVKLIEEYNTKLSTDEDQKQYILKVVSEYRKKYPDCRKTTLVDFSLK